MLGSGPNVVAATQVVPPYNPRSHLKNDNVLLDGRVFITGKNAESRHTGLSVCQFFIIREMPVNQHVQHVSEVSVFCHLKMLLITFSATSAKKTTFRLFFFFFMMKLLFVANC